MGNEKRGKMSVFIAKMFQCTFFFSFCIKSYTMKWQILVILQQIDWK